MFMGRASVFVELISKPDREPKDTKILSKEGIKGGGFVSVEFHQQRGKVCIPVAAKIPLEYQGEKGWQQQGDPH